MPEFQEKSALKLKVLPEDTKAAIRSKIWDYLDCSGLACYPKIPRRRISNFKGSDEACDKITELDVFKKAHVLRIDPDRPLQGIRYKTLEACKTLLVPTPRLKNHVFSKIVPPADCGQRLLRSCAARQGIKEYSEAIDIDEKIKVDAVIVGCVAVSTNGWRIGKGGGLSDLEYAMMASLGVVDQTVPIITMVHDCQVVDLHDSLFKPHDLPVDYIITPTRIIECTGHLPKPSSILWNLLNDDKLNHIPVLRRIRFREWKSGKDVKLCGEEENPSELVDVVLDEEEILVEKNRVYHMNKHVNRRRDEDGETTGDEDKKDQGDTLRKNASRRRFSKGRSYHNRHYQKKFHEKSLGSDGQTDEDNNNRRRTRNSSSEKQGDSSNEERRRRNYKYNRSLINSYEGSVYAGSLPRELRVSEFKMEVKGRQVRPSQLVWHGASGFAFLNFKTFKDAEDALKALEGLEIKCRVLKFEMAKCSSGGRGRLRTKDNNDNEVDGEEKKD